MSNINLNHVDLNNANMDGVTLINANLYCADLMGAGLSGADLSGSNLTRAKLTYATGFSCKQAEGGVKGAKSLEDATMPNGLKYEEWFEETKGGCKE